MSDTVNHPKHYNFGNIEVIDFIDQVAQGYDKECAYYAGNIIKYIARAPFKNGTEDIQKAQWYLKRMLETVSVQETETELPAYVRNYKLYDRNKQPVVVMSKINIHSYSVNGLPNTPYSFLHIRLATDELKRFKKLFNLHLKTEIEQAKEKHRRFKCTIVDELIAENARLHEAYDLDAITPYKNKDVNKKTSLERLIIKLAKGAKLESDLKEVK